MGLRGGRWGSPESKAEWPLCQGTRAVTVRTVGFLLPGHLLLPDSRKGRGWGGSRALWGDQSPARPLRLESWQPSSCPTPWTQSGGSKGRSCRGLAALGPGLPGDPGLPSRLASRRSKWTRCRLSALTAAPLPCAWTRTRGRSCRVWSGRKAGAPSSASAPTQRPGRSWRDGRPALTPALPHRCEVSPCYKPEKSSLCPPPQRPSYLQAQAAPDLCSLLCLPIMTFSGALP